MADIETFVVTAEIMILLILIINNFNTTEKNYSDEVHPVPNSPTGTISEPNLKRFALKALMLCIQIFAACILLGVYYRQNHKIAWQNHKIASGTRDEPLWIKSLQPVCLRSNNVTMHTTIQISGSSGYLDDFTINAIHKAIKANEKIKFDVKCKAWVPITFSASEPYVANCQDMELFMLDGHTHI